MTPNPFVGGVVPLQPTAVPLGMNSPEGQSEWYEFLRRRRELIDAGMMRLGLSTQLGMQSGMGLGPTFQATSLLLGTPTQQVRGQHQQEPLTEQEYVRLLGAADFYGIENAQVLEPNALRQQIEEHREYLQSRRLEEDPTVGGAIYDTIATFIGTTGLGMVDAVAGGLQRIPFVGDALRKHTGIQQFQQGLSMLEEGFTGDMLDNERAAYEKYARPLQHFLGYSALVGVAAEGVGATGFAAGVANPLIRGSLQGAATGWVLEGGGDDPISERVMKIALFSGLQGAAEWGLPKIMARLNRSFFRPSTWFTQEARMGRAGGDPGTVDAEWYFMDEAGGLIAGPPRQIGPAGMAGGAAPPGSPLLGPGGIPGRPITPVEPVPGPGTTPVPSPVQSLPVGATPLGPGYQLMPGQLRPGTMQVAAGYTSFPRGQQLPTMEAAGGLQQGLRYTGWQPDLGMGQYSVIEGDARLHTFITPSGQPVEVRTDFVPDQGTVFVNWLGAPVPPGVDPASLPPVPGVGPGTVRNILGEIAGQHPEAGTIRGWRISGAGAEREAVVKTSHLRPLQETAEEVQEILNSPLQGPRRGMPIELPPIRGGSPLTYDIENILPAWNEVSARYPRLASRVRSIEIDLGVYTRGGQAEWVERTRTLRLGWYPQLTPELLVHELTHVAQGARRQITEGGRAGLTAERIDELEFYAENNAERYRLNTAQASVDAVSVTKQGTILESPILPGLAKQPEIQDADIAVAAMATNPGQISIIQGVGDTASTIRRFLQEFMPNGVGPQDFRAIKRGDRTDILVADGRTITNKMAKEYETFGMFRGQQAVTAQGQQVIIEQLGPEFSEVRTISGGVSTVPTGELMPGKSSMIADAAPEAYIEMKSYALSRMAQEATDSNLPLFDWFSDEMATQLPRYIEEFLSMRGVEGTGARAVFTASFTEARVREFRTLAPEEFAQVDSLQQEAGVALVQRAVRSGRAPSIEEIAETKGLRWEPTPNTEGGRLIDVYSNDVIPVENREAAFAFLRDFNRTLPDYSPFTTVPAELLTSPAGAATPGSSMSPDYIGTVDDLVEDGVRALDRIDADLFEAGGGMIPPDGGGIPLGGGGAGGGGLPPGAAGMTPGDEFGVLRDATFGRWRRLEVRFDSSLKRWLEPMRGYAARVTEDMNRAGIRANYWDEITGIENSMAVAHNEMEPWVRQFSEALARIRNHRVRDGTVVLIGELPPAQAIAAMQNAGYTQREFEGQQQLRQLWERVGQEYGVARILDYWPHIRASDSPEMAVQRILRQDFEGPGRWFAEQIRQGGIDYREMNAEILVNKWLRGAVFSRHVAPHVERMTVQWVQEPRIPENLRETTSDWLSLVTTGYVPGGDRIFDGVASVMQGLQIPVNTRDVETLVRWTTGNVYRALLGGRPHAVLREMLNPLMAWARIGNTVDFAQVMVNFARDPGYRVAAVERGVQGGWIMRYAHGRLAQEPFRAAGRASVPGIAVPENEFAPWQNTVREGVAQVGDAIADTRNRVMPRGFTNSLIDPLMPMDKVNEFGRLIAGESAFQSMSRALREYNAARSAAGPLVNERSLYAQLLRMSGAANLHESVQRAIVQRISVGDQEGGAILFANEAANQLGRFGQVDAPPAMHRTGIIGRWGTMFGNFAINYQSIMREGISKSGLAREFGGGGLDRAASGTKFLARHGMILGALGLAAGYTGWNFAKWMWHGSLGWGGGPFLWAVVDGIRRNGARFKEANGEFLTPQERALLVETNDNLGQATWNPYMGYLQTFDRLGQAASTSSPMEAAAQYLVTGQMTGTEFTRPHSDATFGTPPLPAWLQGQVPPLQPVAPPGTGGQF